eukprot:TRINITY_DN67676_c6_g11_i1.p1 TRINITY_DN67676_c6_g11~~TRINITY_DN67676_c6_g11_i1.p1  ORF type:complete len:301 (-),score=16.94 TRINITY_DN67676_c6_g11_i1:125-1006(-)
MPKLPNIFLWSMPRTVSTATGRAFLASGKYNFLMEPVNIGQIVHRALSVLPEPPPTDGLPQTFDEAWEIAQQNQPWFWKEHASLAYHYTNFQPEARIAQMSQARHIILIREPKQQVASFLRTTVDIGYILDPENNPGMVPVFEAWFRLNPAKPARPPTKKEWLSFICSPVPLRYMHDFITRPSPTGLAQPSIVVDGQDVAEKPDIIIPKLCKLLGVELSWDEMKSWDGDTPDVPPALKGWVEGADKSTGLSASHLRTDHWEIIPESWHQIANEVIEEATPHYLELKKLAITAD